MNDLNRLRGLCKTDADGYKDEFEQQWQRYVSELEIVILNPAVFRKSFVDLIDFFSRLSEKNKSKNAELSVQLLQLLEKHGERLHPQTRKALVTSITFLRNKNVVDSSTVWPLFMNLLRFSDKPLREAVSAFFAGDVKRLQQNQQQQKRSVQGYLYRVLSEDDPVIAARALQIVVDAYRSRFWTDERTVNVIASGCLSKHVKTMLTSMHFFLGEDERAREDAEDHDDDDSDDPAEYDDAEFQKKVQELHRKWINGSKKTRKKKRDIDRAISTMKSRRRRAKEKSAANFAALDLLHDPQGLAEKVFARLRSASSGEKFDNRLVMIQFISRLISFHDLLLMNFYPFLQRYMSAHQPMVTQILAYCAQSVHSLVPPDVLQPIIRTLADNFVSDKNAPEAMAVGLNAIREICERQPLCMEEDLLTDLIQYKSYKDKSVMMAARSLIGLFRNVQPELLKRSERGRAGAELMRSANRKKLVYGASTVSEHVLGIELLALYKARERLEQLGLDSSSDEDEDEDDEDEDDEEDEEDDGEEEVEEEDSENEGEVVEDSDSSDEEEGEEVEGAEEEEEEEDDDDDEEDDEEGDEDDEEGDEDEDEDEDEEDVVADPSALKKKSEKVKVIRVNMDSSDDEDDEDEDDEEEEDEDEEENDDEEEEEEGEEEGDEEDEEDEDEEDEEEESSNVGRKRKHAETARSLKKTESKNFRDDEFRKLAGTVLDELKRMETEEFLSDDDFATLARLREDEDFRNEILGGKGTRHLRVWEELFKLTPDATVNPGDIESFQKKRRQDLEERLASVAAGKVAFKFKNRKMKRGGGTTNREKLKNKPAMMIVHSDKVRRKQFMSRGESMKRRKISDKKQVKFKIKRL